MGLSVNDPGTAATVVGLLVDDTLSRDSDGTDGWGVDVVAGARLTLTSARLSGNRYCGLGLQSRSKATVSGLLVDGVAGPATWRLLERFQRPGERLGDHRRVLGFESFHGDLAWLQDREGHVGKPYWPGGIAGVTLDPGFDLRFARLERIREHHSVIARRRAAELRPLVALIGPLEVAGIHDGPADVGAMTPDELGGRVHVDVDSVIEGT